MSYQSKKKIEVGSLWPNDEYSNEGKSLRESLLENGNAKKTEKILSSSNLLFVSI